MNRSSLGVHSLLHQKITSTDTLPETACREQLYLHVLRAFLSYSCAMGFNLFFHWTYRYVKQRNEFLLPFGHLISFLLNTLTCAKGFTTLAFNFSGLSNSMLLVFVVSSRAARFLQPPFPMYYCHVQDVSKAMVKNKQTKKSTKNTTKSQQVLQSKHVYWYNRCRKAPGRVHWLSFSSTFPFEWSWDY